MAVMLTVLQETVICYARIAPCSIVLTYFLHIQFTKQWLQNS